MPKSYRLLIVAVAAMFVATGAAAQNILVNPGFEDGLNGWITFGSVYSETTNLPQFDPYEGSGLASMFGNWSGPYNVSGMFQEFPTVQNGEWTMSCKSRHYSGDAMTGTGATDFNWAVMKIAWFDAGGTEIGGEEVTILDGTFTTDVWHDNGPLVAKAPKDTVKMQALILYIQVGTDGGACQVDNVQLYQSGGPVGTEESSWGAVKALNK
jgi:hypothetical protein